MQRANTAQSIAFRCDGDERVGAGHVGRCLALADGFSARGWQPIFVGSYEGLARTLISTSGHGIRAPVEGAAGGVGIACDAAILDSYSLHARDIARLAQQTPAATLAEGPSSPNAIHVDFHLDRWGEQETRWLLPGPRFAPVDRRYRQIPRDAASVRRVLVTLGGGIVGHGVLPLVREQIVSRFSDAEIVEPCGAGPDRSAHRPLYDLVEGLDLAVCGAGFTAYELATAGVPSVLVQLADNQDRVARGMAARGLAAVTDARRPDFPSQLSAGLEALDSPIARARVAALAVGVFDGRGVERTVDALISRWFADS
jgi:spore coat polysaccharide biosynthesis predicted glycosyltransferase SpsG